MEGGLASPWWAAAAFLPAPCVLRAHGAEMGRGCCSEGESRPPPLLAFSEVSVTFR